MKMENVEGTQEQGPKLVEKKTRKPRAPKKDAPIDAPTESPTESPNDTGFNMVPVEAKPKSKFHKKSKYDPIIDQFIAEVHSIQAVDVVGKDANYLRTQLKKRIDALEISNITVSVANAKCYLEKA